VERYTYSDRAGGMIPGSVVWDSQAFLGVSSGVTSASASVRLRAGSCNRKGTEGLVNKGDCRSLHLAAFCCNHPRMDFKSRASASFATRAGDQNL